ncbi:MAG: T9SS type A sorting domain-containing protein, partial [Chitinophagales bacterium]|nr:T9SS type A sorting domain-containing protein [Chitinophagales bacterium]
NENTVIRLFDIQGRTILQDYINKEGYLTHTIDLSFVENGAYLLAIEQQGRVVVKRIIVQH